MKKFSLFIFIIGICTTLGSCTSDFDELKDSDHRSVSFRFDPSEYLANVVHLDNLSESAGYPFGLEDGYMLRITGYCYTPDGTLCKKESLLSTDGKDLHLDFTHLDKNICYDFTFIADFVQPAEGIVYNEIWYQLDTSKKENLYIYRKEQWDSDKYNTMLVGDLQISPSNQTLDVEMKSTTFHGIFTFSETEEFESVKLTLEPHADYKLSDKSGRYLHLKNFDIPLDRKVFVPMLYNGGDTYIIAKFTLQRPGEEAKEYTLRTNIKQQNFHININCKSTTYYIWYDSSYL